MGVAVGSWKSVGKLDLSLHVLAELKDQLYQLSQTYELNSQTIRFQLISYMVPVTL